MVIENKSEIDFQEVVAWFRILYRNATGYLHIASSGNWAGRFFSLRDGIGLAANHVERLGRSTTAGIYARVTSVTSPPVDDRLRGGVQLTECVPALWADLDIAGPGHKHEACEGAERCPHVDRGHRKHPHRILPLPPNEGVARAILEATCLPPPSLWVHSGGGLYPIWLINPVHRITDDLQWVQQISSEWQRIIRASAERAGYHYGAGVGDLARVLRIPGTWNRKTADQRQCVVVDHTSDGFRISTLAAGLELARGMLPAPPVAPVAQPTPRARPNGDVRAGDDFSNRVDWMDPLLLGRLGWRMTVRRGNYREWLRPDAGSSSTLSATTGRGVGDNLFVFSTETIFPAGIPISKLEAYRIIYGHATYTEAIRALAARGFGSAPSTPALPPALSGLHWPTGYTRTRQ